MTMRCVIFLILMSMAAQSQAIDGIYLWKSEVVQDENSQYRLFKNLQKHHVNRLYLGLNAKQVKDPAAFSKDMIGLFLTAKKAGVEVWLLLGDSGWFSPAERPKLTRIVRDFESLPFDGVLLDLEVEQLGFPASPSLLVQWVDTVESVIESTQKPVSIASHWRWFSGDSPVCMSCEFARIGVRDISLMIYTTNIDIIVKVAHNSALLSGLPVRIAQSIETSLDSSESWAHVPTAAREDGISELKVRLMGTPIDWQAYEYINYLD
jgi:hypothetical protein